MITDIILDFFLCLPKLLLKALPAVDVSIPDNVFNGINDFIAGVAYLYPVPECMPIITISLGISMFKIVWALTIRIKSFIPTMGA